MTTFRIVIAGAGVAGSIVARGLQGLPGVEVICLERVGEGAHGEAGTGLNVGPNAVTALREHLPDLARTVEAASLPWRRWTIDLTDGTRLFDLDIETVADNPGIRIRWAELYCILREGLPIRYGNQTGEVERQKDGRLRVGWRSGEEAGAIDDVDLLIGAEGRYSDLRDTLVGPSAPRYLGVSMYRVLLPRTDGCPIDDYGQWFNGPNRLLAFTVPGDLVYCAGAFPIETPDGSIPDTMRRPDVLRSLYTPKHGTASPQAAFLIDGIARHAGEIHWARVQEEEIAFAVDGWPVLLVGDAAHPMIPTLGQGATQAVEDACCVVDLVRSAVGAGGTLAGIPTAVDAARRSRVQFVMDFSRDASDTMLSGADPVAGTLAKRDAPFQEKLVRLYRDVPRQSGLRSL